MSFGATARISPKSNPIISKRINDKKLITTKPTAKDEWASNPNKASPGKLVVFCSFNKTSATAEETKKTDKAILISKDKARVTPSNAEWDKVSPKKDSLLQITKHPRGPATKAMPMPAISALIKKSSSIINVSFL